MKARIGDIDIHYTVTGQGPWITLSHSLAAHSGMWAPQVRLLSPHFTVLCVDTRGHGGTDAPPGPYTLAQLADDAHGLLQHLGVARTHWLGLDPGGRSGQRGDQLDRHRRPARGCGGGGNDRGVRGSGQACAVDPRW